MLAGIGLLGCACLACELLTFLRAHGSAPSHHAGLRHAPCLQPSMTLWRLERSTSMLPSHKQTAQRCWPRTPRFCWSGPTPQPPSASTWCDLGWPVGLGWVEMPLHVLRPSHPPSDSTSAFPAMARHPCMPCCCQCHPAACLPTALRPSDPRWDQLRFLGWGQRGRRALFAAHHIL